jgi:hypothetical protein
VLQRARTAFPSFSARSEAPDVHFRGEEDARPVERRLVSHVVRHPQREVGELVGRVEGGLEHGVGPRPRLGRRGAVPGGVVAASGAHVEAAPAAHLHLDLPEGPVAGGVRRVVADQVVDARLVGDALQPPREVVRVADGEAAAVGGEALRALRRLHRLGEGEPEVLRGQEGAVLGGEGVGQALEPPAVDEVDRGVDAPRRVEDPLELRELGVVDEALGDEDDGLPAPDRREAVHRPLERAEGQVVARRRLVVDLGRPGGDDRVLDRHHAPHVRALLRSWS